MCTVSLVLSAKWGLTYHEKKLKNECGVHFNTVENCGNSGTLQRQCAHVRNAVIRYNGSV